MQKSSNHNEAILHLIDDCQRTQGYSPSVREIAAGMGFKSSSIAKYHLDKLERAKLIKRDPFKVRAIQITPAARALMDGDTAEKVIQLVLPYPVSVNALYVPVAKGKLVLSEAARQYKDLAGWTAKAAYRDDPLRGAVSFKATLYRPQKSGDLNNFLKVLEDTLTGIVYEDDQQIVEEHLHRRDDPANPRVEVTVWEVRHADAD